jgi:hypothetical protein
MKTKMLFRPTGDQKEELKICQKHFSVSDTRIGMSNSLVIARFPGSRTYYRELENDLKLQGSYLINSYFDHNFIASFDWYHELKDMTPKSYFSLQDVPKDGGPFVLKGRTNSRKHQWREKMYAKDYKDAVRIYFELMNDDPAIADQGIVIRDFIPLEDFGEGVNGQPFANEWRCFFYKEELLSFGYYWINGDIIPDNSVFDETAMNFAKSAALKISDRCNYFVLDIAKTKKGEWIVIEVNDGQYSGLSGNDAETLYTNLVRVLK